jgi:hypothetical protein
MQDIQLAPDLVVIGILGASPDFPLPPLGRHLSDVRKRIGIAALQGAFAEHQAML